VLRDTSASVLSSRRHNPITTNSSTDGIGFCSYNVWGLRTSIGSFGPEVRVSFGYHLTGGQLQDVCEKCHGIYPSHS
jgi:hypothetical protein